MKEKIWKAISGLWFGKMLFFSFAIAPTIFRVLDKPVAAHLQQNLFPIYYSVGIVCGFLLFALDFLRGKKKIGLIAVSIAIGVIGLSILTPLIREASLTASSDMKLLHPIAVVLNLIQMILVFLVL